MYVLQNSKSCRCIIVRLFIIGLAFITVLASSTVSAFAENAISAKEGPYWNDRYAVALYGIQHDRYADQSGVEAGTAGLTFGPATGRKYLETYRAHVTLEEYEEDPETNICLHWMTWEEIANQSLKDPTAFHNCLVQGCTHAVDLVLNSTLLSKDYSSKITGDGVGGILNGVKRVYLSWDNNLTSVGGWPACRARAVLNGADEWTNPKAAGEKYLLSTEECLFSCFPENLQELIVPKIVVSDLGNGKPKKERECVTTCDKLWFFSASEFYGGPSPVEGKAYERTELIRMQQTGFGGRYTMYCENGNEVQCWLRSVSYLSEVINQHIYGGGHWTGSGYYNHFGLDPGCCLCLKTFFVLVLPLRHVVGSGIVDIIIVITAIVRDVAPGGKSNLNLMCL